jgi:hypothetical protein
MPTWEEDFAALIYCKCKRTRAVPNQAEFTRHLQGIVEFRDPVGRASPRNPRRVVLTAKLAPGAPQRVQEVYDWMIASSTVSKEFGMAPHPLPPIPPQPAPRPVVRPADQQAPQDAVEAQDAVVPQAPVPRDVVVPAVVPNPVDPLLIQAVLQALMQAAPQVSAPVVVPPLPAVVAPVVVPPVAPVAPVVVPPPPVAPAAPVVVPPVAALQVAAQQSTPVRLFHRGMRGLIRWNRRFLRSTARGIGKIVKMIRK